MRVAMRRSLPLLPVLFAIAGVASPPASAPAVEHEVSTEPTSATGQYICPPCGYPCDSARYDAPGTCPSCGMTLVTVESVEAQARTDVRKKVAILIFDGAQIIDFTGPYEMFGAADCDVYTVAARTDPITTAMGMAVVPKYAFATAPQPDVLVIPGGSVRLASKDPTTLDYIKAVTKQAQVTMSVCNGAFILANTGLLDGKSATTTYGHLDRFAHDYPQIDLVRDRRYVDNGKTVTTAGLSAGIDGALHVIARLFGVGQAQQVALGEEYDWKPDAGLAHGALAVHQIPDLGLHDVGEWRLIRTEGDTGHWDMVARGHCDLTVDDLMKRMTEAFASHGWKRVAHEAPDPASRTNRWRFVGTDGKPWKGTLGIEVVDGASDEFRATISVARAE